MKNEILKAVTIVAAIVWLVSLTMLDAPSLKPFAIFMTATAWLAYFGWCNGWFEAVKR